ncbi:MAG TPA: TonB-dependent receptor [Pyrinomonadaceae bacterium]|nr:TonB-dependent receptor [Pyrinomonadaceae bacterium]
MFVRTSLFAFVFGICALATMGRSADPRTAVLSGRVVDANGHAISGALIRLQLKSGVFHRSATTDDAGSFECTSLPPGTYVLTADARGFAPLSQELALTAGDTRSVDLTLQLGSIAEEVIVGTTRLAATPEDAEGIPGSVEIIERATIESSRPVTSTEVLRKVSGIHVRDEEGLGLRPNIGIRGLNPTRSTKVLLLEDGIPLTYAPYGDNASYYHPPIERFEGAEVLKGSGQIVYGPQTVGGVINYVTPNPPTNWLGSLTVVGGNRDYFNGHINYGGTVKNTGLLFGFTRKQGKGARADIRSGMNDFNFKSVTTIGDKQAVTTKFNHYGEDSQVTYSGLTEAEFQANPRQNPFRNDHFNGRHFDASVAHAFVFNPKVVLTTSIYGAYFRRHWWRQSSNSGERPNRLRTLPGGDPDCTGMADLNTACGNQGRLRKYHFVGVEPRLHVTKRLFGLKTETDFGFRAHFETQQRRQENGDLPTSRSGALVEHNERRNGAYSGFIQPRFIAGNWTITPGIRVEHIRYERTNRLGAGGAIIGHTQMTQLIPGLGVSYSPSRRLTVFGGVHRGFAPPRTEDVINNNSGASVDLDAELSWNYEVGMRSVPVDGLRLEATFFRMDYENQIVPATVAGGVGATFTNGGSTMHQGIELSGRFDAGTFFRSTHNFYFRGAYTFLPDAYFTGTRFSSVGGFTNVSVSGNRLPYAPRHLANATFGYSHPKGFDALLEAVHVANQFSDDLSTIVPTANGQRGLIPSYTVWNSTLNYNVESLHTTFFVTIKNVFDETYIVDRSRGLLPSPPRMIQAGLKVKF